jgi:hypothetical protein
MSIPVGIDSQTIAGAEQAGEKLSTAICKDLDVIITNLFSRIYRTRIVATVEFKEAE